MTKQWDINDVGKLYTRPWGTYRTIEQEKNYQIKHIVVFPGKRLSYQYHRHRSEHWTIIKGQGLMTLNNNDYKMKVDDSMYIPIEAKHRMSNISNDDLEFIEIQIGDYLGEDDIVRIIDDYGRL